MIVRRNRWALVALAISLLAPTAARADIAPPPERPTWDEEPAPAPAVVIVAAFALATGAGAVALRRRDRCAPRS